MVLRDRAAGALPSLTVALSNLMNLEARAGHLRRAEQLAHEHAEAQRAFTDPKYAATAFPMLAALRADDPDVGAEIMSVLELAARHGLGSGELNCRASLTVLHVGRGEYADAVQAGRALPDCRAPWSTIVALPDLIEGAARSGDLGFAAQVLAQFEERVEAAPTPWAFGLLARCQALLSAGDRAESAYQQAVQHLHDANLPLDQARAHLLYGEWMRRGRRRTDAVHELRVAHDMFSAMRAEAFTDRARKELNAAGARPRRRVPETRDDLTAQEHQVAEAAADGATNREIAATMFLSEATIAYHLRKVFQKLGIT